MSENQQIDGTLPAIPHRTHTEEEMGLMRFKACREVLDIHSSQLALSLSSATLFESLRSS